MEKRKTQSHIKKLWKHLKKVIPKEHLHPPATSKQIKKLERTLGFKLPLALKTSLEISNGGLLLWKTYEEIEEDDDETCEDDLFNAVGYFELFSTDKIESEYKSWMETMRSGMMDTEWSKEEIIEHNYEGPWYSRLWIPFVGTDCEPEHYAIDMNDSYRIFMDHESGPFVTHNSNYTQYLQSVVDYYS